VDISVSERDGASVVALTGRLDLLSAAQVKARLAQEAGAGLKRLVVDLGDVSFIDSSGLGALISALKAARVAGGDLRIARPSDQARVILKLTTLDRVMKPYASVEEALADF
jgi:anti-sigma B factor antagonist